MLSIRTDLLQLLNEQTGLQVYYYMPPVECAVSMPLLILEEVENTDYFYKYNDKTDKEIEVANVTYEVSIYATNPSDLFVFLPIVDTVMKRAGFKKTYTSGDNHVEPLYCKTLRFTGRIQQLEDGYHIYR